MTLKTLFHTSTTFLLFVFITYSENSGAQDLLPIDSGATGHVNTLTVYKDELYAGGEFYFFNSRLESTCSNIAKWNGEKWSKVGNDTIRGEVYTLIEYKGELYAGGIFTINRNQSMTSVAKWNGISWESVGGNIEGNVMLLTEYNNELYACIEKDNVNYVLKKNGTQWFDVSGKITGQICSLTVFKGNLYCIGNIYDTTMSKDTKDFSRWVQPRPLYLAKYDGNNWLRIDTTYNFQNARLDNVVSVSIFKDNLYIASYWSYPEDMTYISVDAFVKWDGINDVVSVKADTIDYSKTWGYVSGSTGVFRDELYAFGNFWYNINQSGVYFAKWDGDNWSVLEKETGWSWEAVNAMCVYKGEFYLAGKESTHCIAKLNPATKK